MKKEIKPPRHPHQDGDDEKNLAQLAAFRIESELMRLGQDRIDQLRQLVTKKDATRRTTIINEQAKQKTSRLG